MAVLEQNVLDPQYTRYILVGDELEAYLADKYGADNDYNVSHDNDRWTFYAPEKLNKKQIKAMTKEIVARKRDAVARENVDRTEEGSGNRS